MDMMLFLLSALVYSDQIWCVLWQPWPEGTCTVLAQCNLVVTKYTVWWKISPKTPQQWLYQINLVSVPPIGQKLKCHITSDSIMGFQPFSLKPSSKSKCSFFLLLVLLIVACSYISTLSSVLGSQFTWVGYFVPFLTHKTYRYGTTPPKINILSSICSNNIKMNDLLSFQIHYCLLNPLLST